MATKLMIMSAVITNVLLGQIGLDCDETQECKDMSWLRSDQHVFCRGYESCLDSTIIMSNYNVYVQGLKAAEGSTIQAPNIYAYGYDALLNAKVTALSSVDLYGHDSGRLAEITTPIINAYGYQSAEGATIKTDGSTLTVNLYGYQSGYDTQIICSNGDTCNVNCISDACHVSSNPTKLYCYNGAICKPSCEDATQCPDIIGGPESSLTDPQIHEIYLKDRKRIENELRKPESYEYRPKDNDTSKWILSFSTSQFMLLAVLNALFVFSSVGLCLWNISTTKNKHNYTKQVNYDDE